MEKCFQEMIDYLKGASKEQLLADWEKHKKDNEIGPLAEDFIKDSLRGAQGKK